jgi:hypothetical protein
VDFFARTVDGLGGLRLVPPAVGRLGSWALPAWRMSRLDNRAARALEINPCLTALPSWLTAAETDWPVVDRLTARFTWIR